MHQNPVPPKRDPGLTFLGMSGGILMLVIALVILFPILCCVGMMVMGIVGSAVSPEPTPSFTFGN